MPLSDVLTMAGRGTGRFVIWNHPSEKSFHIYLKSGQLNAFSVDQKPVKDVLKVKGWIVELMASKEGDFAFERMQPVSWNEDFNLPVDQIIASSLAEIGNMETFKEHLPSLETVFEPVYGVTVWLEPDLEEFWEKSKDFLAKSTSGNELVQVTSFTPDQVQHCLYKLRSSGLIKPLRAFKMKPASEVSAAVAVTQYAQEHPVPVTAPAAAHVATASPQGATEKKEQLTAGRGVLSKLMLGIRKKFSH